MKLLRRGKSDTADNGDHNGDHEVVESTAVELASSSETEGKGRPTPKRREAEGKRRGPVAPAPLTSKDARARKKQTRGSKEDRKQASTERRATAADRRARMLAGEDKFLLPRDRGPVRGYVRDLVDARRHLVGMFLPLAVLVILAMFLPPAIQAIGTLATLIMMVFMAVEGILMGRRINNRVRERFPDATEGGFKLGWYAFARAMQIRKMRAPKPRVSPGDAV